MIFGCLILINNVIYLLIIHTSYLNSVLYAVSCKTPFTPSRIASIAGDFRGALIFPPHKRPVAQPRTTSLACVAWRFWLGALSNKGGRGQRNREEIGAEATWKTAGFYFSRGFPARSRALRARISRLLRSCARLDKTAMLRRLQHPFRIVIFAW